MYKQHFPLTYQQELICHKAQPTTNQFQCYSQQTKIRQVFFNSRRHNIYHIKMKWDLLIQFINTNLLMQFSKKTEWVYQ